MIEPALFFGLGFLTAGLLALVIVPLVHARAVRLTRRRLENAGPMSLAEIQSDKDRLRAEFALTARRLELSVEQLREKTTSQLAEIGRKTAAVNALKAELAEKTAGAVAVETRERMLADKLSLSEQSLAETLDKLREADAALALGRETIAKLTRENEEHSVSIDSQRIEIIALNTQLATLRDTVDELEEKLRATQGQRDRALSEAEGLRRSLSEAQVAIAQLEKRDGEIIAALRAQEAEADKLGRRVATLEPRLADRDRAFAEAAHERDRLREIVREAAAREQELSAHLADVQNRSEADIKHLLTEKAVIEGQLDRAREERTRLQRELAALRREAEDSWQADQRESAMLRERISDVAAEVARLTMALEGPDSPIPHLVSEDAMSPFVGAGPANDARAAPLAPAGLSLADRIRMLQSRASRASKAS
jgi:chromosome segregation ATPase